MKSVYILFVASAVFLAVFFLVSSELQSSTYYTAEQKEGNTVACENDSFQESRDSGDSTIGIGLQCYDEDYLVAKKSYFVIPEYMSGSLDVEVNTMRAPYPLDAYSQRHEVYAYDLLGISVLLSVVGGATALKRYKSS